MRTAKKAAEVRHVGATLYYRDSVGGRFAYVKGRVTDFKSVQAAHRDWDQKWSHPMGTILEIMPIEAVDESRKKYRHMSSVLSPSQYREKEDKRAGEKQAA